MNILYICHRIPYPPNKGDKIRSFNEMKYLSKNHNIFLAFLVDNKKDVIYIDEVKKYCETIDYDVINPQWQKIKSLPYLFSKKPLTVPYFYSKKLQNAIDYRVSTIKFDAIFAFSSPMAEYVFKSKALDVRDVRNVRDVRTIRTSVTTKQFEHFERAKRSNTLNDPGFRPRLIMDFVDVDSDKWRMYSEHSLFPKSLLYRNEWKRLMTYEKKVGETFDISVFVSDAELELFKSFTPNVNAVSIPNGVDFEYFGDVRDVRSVRDVRTNEVIERAKQSNGLNILFTGAMDYFPNEDAVLYFYYKIWPIVKNKLPQSRFYIVGGNPSKKLKSISAKDEDIVVTGRVNDVRGYMLKADVFIAPLRIAKGIQNKVLEAMAAGLPVVARPEAVKGLNGYDGCIRVEESNERFAFSILEIINDTRIRHKIINDSKRYILKNHNWGKNLKQFEKLLEGI